MIKSKVCQTGFTERDRGTEMRHRSQNIRPKSTFASSKLHKKPKIMKKVLLIVLVLALIATAHCAKVGKEKKNKEQKKQKVCGYVILLSNCDDSSSLKSECRM
jgi:hypothetical protein